MKPYDKDREIEFIWTCLPNIDRNSDFESFWQTSLNLKC